MKPPHTLHTLCLCLLAASAWAADEKTMPTVTVTGTYDSVDDRRTSATQKTVVSRKEIEQLGGLTVGEVLGKLPGVEAGGSGGEAMRARGMMRDSVQILIDGERMAGNSRMALSVVGRLPSGELERVEIIRGSSAEFGGAAPVTVNLVMRRALSKASQSLKAAVGLREDRPISQFSGSAGDSKDGFSWLLPLTLNHHETPGSSDSDRQHFAGLVRDDWQRDHEESGRGFNENVTSPRFTWKQGSDSFTLWPTVFYGVGKGNTDLSRQAYAIPASGGGLADDGGRHDHEETKRLMLRVRGEGEMTRGDNKFSGRLAISKGRQDTDIARDSFDASLVHTLSSEQQRRDDLEANASLRLDRAMGEHLLAGSLEAIVLRRDDEQTLTSLATYRSREKQWTAWLQDEWNVAKGLVFTGGVRGEAVNLEVDGVSRDYSRLSPSVALRWEPDKAWVVRTSLGLALKPPRLDELSDMPVTNLNANTPLEADRRGNPDLLPERSINFEAVLEHYLADKAGVLGANFYWRATDNFVERRIELEGSRWVDRPRNEGDAVHYGLELDAKVKTDGWGLKGGTLRGHLTLPRSEVKDARLGLTRIARETPTYQLTLGHDQSLPAWQASVGFQAQFYGRTKSDVPGEQWASSEARTMLDLYALRKLTPNLNLRLNLQNVLGTGSRKSQAAWDGSDTWRLEGDSDGTRSLMLSLEGKW